MTERRYQCPACAKTWSLQLPRWRCECGSHLNLTPGPGLRRDEILTDHRSLWRYAAALPMSVPPQVTLGEGWTPLIDGSWRGCPIKLKLEYVSPSGSFKDRGIAVLVDYLARNKIDSVMEDSSGNGGAALAMYAAAAGIACRILVPATTSASKIVQIAATGAKVELVPGSRHDTAERALREAEFTFYASHNRHPFFLEGTKTIGYELWEGLGFRAPDNVVVPLGGGSGLLGCYLAFGELLRRDAIDRMPRLFGVQAARCSPIHASFVAGTTNPVATTIGDTIAEGIAISEPVHLPEVLEALRVSGGRTVSVEEDAIVAALSALARMGLFVEPTSAAAAAGLTALLARGAVARGETTVLVLTGSGLKATEVISRALGLRSTQ